MERWEARTNACMSNAMSKQDRQIKQRPMSIRLRKSAAPNQRTGVEAEDRDVVEREDRVRMAVAQRRAPPGENLGVDAASLLEAL